MLSAIGAAFALVFVAELGDRTQLIVLTAGVRYRPAAVLGALVVAVGAVQAIAVTAGALVGDLLSAQATAAFTAVLFAGFAVWTWRSAPEDDDDELTDNPGGIWRLAGAFALAEFGDKSMLASAALAANASPLGTWIGATLAETVLCVIGLLAGQLLARHFSPRILLRAGAVAFGIAATVSAYEALR